MSDISFAPAILRRYASSACTRTSYTPLLCSAKPLISTHTHTHIPSHSDGTAQACIINVYEVQDQGQDEKPLVPEIPLTNHTPTPKAMAPNETTILTNYLLLPADLPAIISLKDFTALFPKSHQANPQIRTLYRDLQHQRRLVIDAVAANIAAEAKRGAAIRRDLARARQSGVEEGEGDDELEIERAVCLLPLPYTSPPTLPFEQFSVVKVSIWWPRD